MIKILSICFFFYINVHATLIKDLQNEFYNNVVLKNISKKYSSSKQNGAIKYHESITYLYPNNLKRIRNLLNYIIEKDEISKDEYFSIVNLEKQTYIIVLYIHKTKTMHIIGSDLISSGSKDRESEIKAGEDHYFDTPTGIYNVKKAWRSDGEFKTKDKKIQSYGSKGNFIYYFGKMKEYRYHTFDKNRKKILNKKDYAFIKDTLNFAIHSYNSKEKLGYAYSHGCVRLSDSLNKFLENNLVLHKNFYKNNKWKLKYSAEPKQIKNKNLNGSYIFIVKNL